MGAATNETTLQKDPSRGVLNERGSTHGDYEADSKFAVESIEHLQQHPRWNSLPAFMKHSLIMQEVKKARIMNGNAFFYDHWRDIAGYAKLVEERLGGEKK